MLGGMLKASCPATLSEAEAGTHAAVAFLRPSRPTATSRWSASRSSESTGNAARSFTWSSLRPSCGNPDRSCPPIRPGQPDSRLPGARLRASRIRQARFRQRRWRGSEDEIGRGRTGCGKLVPDLRPRRRRIVIEVVDDAQGQREAAAAPAGHGTWLRSWPPQQSAVKKVSSRQMPSWPARSSSSRRKEKVDVGTSSCWRWRPWRARSVPPGRDERWRDASPVPAP